MKAIINNCLHRYIDIGVTTATPVIFIHGFPFSHKMWTTSGGQAEALSGTNRVIAYDVRGHGETEIGSGQYTIEIFVDDLIGLMDHLKIHKAIITGLSMGGYITLRAYEKYPERFLGMVLCDTKCISDTNEGKIKRAESAKYLTANGLKSYAEDYVKRMFTPESFNTKNDAVKLIQSTIEKTSPTSIIGTLIALAARTDSTNLLQKISVPTLILVGEKDTVTTPADSQFMKERIPNAQMQIIPNAAHMSNLENAEEFNKHLTAFVKSIQ
ncbi:MAG: alpha/beta fold hydrolase [Bacteroidetes bacterium]|nr:alpha/beta fold hydrolase [Bacteroidota bacterium]